MAKKKKTQETTIENYYDLKVDKVDELVAILKGEQSREAEPMTMDIQEITGEDVSDKRKKDRNFDPYRRDKLSAIPNVLKAFFIKWWFAGAVGYFVIMGLGVYVSSDLDRLVLAGMVYGLVTDVLINPIFRMIESDKKEFDIYTLFPFPVKHFWTFFANILYYVIVFLLVGMIFSYINVFANFVADTTGMIYLPSEPILLGIFVFIVDMVFIGIKDGIVAIIRRNAKKENSSDV